MLHISTIVFPTDFSEPAIQALYLARSLARDHGAKLILFGVLVPPPPLPEFYPPVEDLEGQVAELKRQLADLAATIHDVAVESDAVQGEPGSAIVAFADTNLADLIVMGTHGRSGLSRLLMGSVAEYVMRNAHCPVLTIKPVGDVKVFNEELVAEPAAIPMGLVAD